MQLSLIIIAFTGLLAGTLHVLSGPDHLAAIAPFTANRPLKSWKIGLWWGMGHTGSIWLIGLLAFFFSGLIHLDGFSPWGERMVGVTLIGLGVWGIQKALRTRVHYHVHAHDGTQHAHFHVHGKPVVRHTSPKAHQHTHAPLGIGVLHGFAGSSHLLAILPALALPGKYNAVSYMAGFGIGSILAMMAFSWIIGTLMQKFVHSFSGFYHWTQIGFSCFAIGVGFFWLMIN